KDALIDAGQVEPGNRAEGARWIDGGQPARLLHADGGDELGAGDLVVEVARHVDAGHSAKDVLGTPFLRGVAEELKLDGQPVADVVDPRVDAARESRGNPLGIGRVTGPLGRRVAAVVD